MSQEDADGSRKIDRITRHLRENKKVYLVGVGGLVFGASAGYLFRPQVVNIVDAFNLKYKSPTTTEITTFIMQPRGNPGDVVMRVSDGAKWASKNEMARDLGVSRSLVVQYFAGKVPDIDGETFVDLGKAGQILATPVNPTV